MKSSTPARLERGRELFNTGHHFEAHEVWEEAWFAEEGPVRLLLQGLIQVAAGYHKAFREGHPKGCVQLLEAGLRKLLVVSGETSGLNLRSFVEGVTLSVAEARRWEKGEQAGLDTAPILALDGP